MGPIDSVGQVYQVPGEVEMHAGAWSGSTLDYVELCLDSAASGGIVRVYQGKSDQTRIATGDNYQADTEMNYRNVAWALVGTGDDGYFMGRQPTPPTLQFLVRRLPKCVRDDDTTTPIRTRGSFDTGHSAYNAANPAAVIYELLTNKVWGRGLSSDLIDETSFIVAADYFAGQNLGMSFKIDAEESITDLLEGIRNHLRTILTWDGETYKIKCLMDIDTTHEFIQTIKSDEVLNLTINRPLWDNVINEVRAEFLSEDRLYRSDMVHAQNLAAKEIMNGWITPSRQMLSGFTIPSVVGQQAQRLLSEVSYPFLTASWEMNRFKSQIEVGDVVRVVWSEFNQTAVTAYFMVAEIEDGASDDENIKITAVEDHLLAPVTGEELTVTLPDAYAWEFIVAPDDDDMSKHIPPVAPDDPIVPITAFEMPPHATGGDAAFVALLGEKVNNILTGSQGAWSNDDVGYNIWGTSSEFALTGTLDDAITSTSDFDRTDGYEITVTDSLKMNDFLAINLVQNPSDDLEALVESRQYFMVIDDEIMQVGYFEAVDSTTVKARNLVRGIFGSKIASHAATSKVFFSVSKKTGYNGGDIPEDSQPYFRAYPVGLWNTVYAAGSSFRTPTTNYYGRGRRPLPPEFVSITDNGSDNYDVVVRPRWSEKGSGVFPFYEAIRNPISANDEGIGLSVYEVDATNATLTAWQVPETFSYTPDGVGGDPDASGVMQFNITLDSSTKLLRVYQTRSGRTSPDYLEIAI
jgi:hypothetical protein